MSKWLKASTLEEAVKEVGEKDEQHIIAAFACRHWFPVCLNILQREGFEAYAKGWVRDQWGHSCRCGFEKTPPVALLEDEDCPICVAEPVPETSVVGLNNETMA